MEKRPKIEEKASAKQKLSASADPPRTDAKPQDSSSGSEAEISSGLRLQIPESEANGKNSSEKEEIGGKQEIAKKQDGNDKEKRSSKTKKEPAASSKEVMPAGVPSIKQTSASEHTAPSARPEAKKNASAAGSAAVARPKMNAVALAPPPQPAKPSATCTDHRTLCIMINYN
jgi:recombination DNA repair RAD52 pathway protein